MHDTNGSPFHLVISYPSASPVFSKAYTEQCVGQHYGYRNFLSGTSFVPSRGHVKFTCCKPNYHGSLAHALTIAHLLQRLLLLILPIQARNSP